MKTGLAILAFGLLALASAAAQSSDQEIWLKFAIDGKSQPCENAKVALRLDGRLIVPKLSEHGFLVPEAFRRKPAEWPENEKSGISITCGKHTFEFSEHPGWVSAGEWEVGIAYPPYWTERFGWTGATENGVWLSYLESECNGCDPGVFTTISHSDPPTAVIASLKGEQQNASGGRARDVAYAMAVFNVDYPRNRDQLMKELDACMARPKNGPEDDVCNDRLLDYITNLYWRGDTALLAPLLQIADSRKDVIGEIGTFYSNLLERRTSNAIQAMKDLPVEKQRVICELAGQDDLSMNGPKFERVAEQLKAANSETADHCLQEIDRVLGRPAP